MHEIGRGEFFKPFDQAGVGGADTLPGGPFSLVYRNADIATVINQVLGEHLQTDFTIAPDVQGQVTLRMQDVADAVGVNVSTVSRAISGKWFQAPGMIRELRSLFTGGTVKDDGSLESRDGVIARIQELVKNEDPAKPLSDAQIVVKLGEVGVRISRRTVTKYRESEGIPSSRERRQY